MNGTGCTLSGWALTRGMWLQQRRNVLLLCTIAFAFGIISRATVPYPPFHACFTGFGYFAMSVSLLASFVMCSFTEADRKRRNFGYPARLFTLPVSTTTLVVAPMSCGVVLACLVYVLWARFGLAQRELPVTWPLLYLAVAMICYQTIVWSLAPLRKTRIVVLGYAGSILAMGWMAFRGESEFAPELSFGASESTRHALCWMLAGAGVLLFWIARAAIEGQRCGGHWLLWRGKRPHRPHAAGLAREQRSAPRRRIFERLSDAWPRRREPFKSPAEAEFWLEWRRHGTLLPLATGGVLLMIMAPAPFMAPISGGTVVLALSWILATPLLVAFVIGKGMGKPDLWSNASGMPLFFAARPLGNSQRIGAKLKMAGAAALSSWILILTSTSLWLWLWCDRQFLTHAWAQLQRSHSPGELAALVVLAIASLITLTFRLLAGSLYIGLSGKRWLVNAAACWVFAAIFGGLAIMLGSHQNPAWLGRVLPLPPWMPEVIAGLFTVKAIAALALAMWARRHGWITGSAIACYFLFWCALTALLIAPLWMIELIPEISLLSALALFAVPLFRMSLAPVALARSIGARP